MRTIEFVDRAGRDTFLKANGLEFKGNQIFPDYWEAAKHPAAMGETLCLRFPENSPLLGELWIALGTDTDPAEFANRQQAKPATPAGKIVVTPIYGKAGGA